MFTAPRAVSRSTVFLGLLLALAGGACRDGATPAGRQAEAPVAASDSMEPRGVSLPSTSTAGLVLDDVMLRRVTADVIELRAELANRGTASVEVGALVDRLAGRAGDGAVALASEDGSTRLYPLMPVDEGGKDGPSAGTTLAPGARHPVAVRFGPVPSGLERLRPLVPGFAASSALPIAENK